MKRTVAIISLTVFSIAMAWGQNDAQQAAAAAAQAIEATPEVEAAPAKPNYWKRSLMTQLNFAQTSYTNWAKGGTNNVALSSFIDGTANYAKEKVVWNNHLQID